MERPFYKVCFLDTGTHLESVDDRFFEFCRQGCYPDSQCHLQYSWSNSETLLPLSQDLENNEEVCLKKKKKYFTWTDWYVIDSLLRFSGMVLVCAAWKKHVMVKKPVKCNLSMKTYKSWQTYIWDWMHWFCLKLTTN